MKFVWLAICSLFLASFSEQQAQAFEDGNNARPITSSPSSQVLLSIHGPAQAKATTPPPAVSIEKTLAGNQLPKIASAAGSLLAADSSADATTPGPGSQTPTPAKPTASPPPAKVPTWQTATPYAPEGEQRRGMDAPLDAVFPSTEWVGQPVIGAPDTDPVWALEAQIYK